MASDPGRSDLDTHLCAMGNKSPGASLNLEEKLAIRPPAGQASRSTFIECRLSFASPG